MLVKHQDSLSLYSIKWLFDMSKLDLKRLKKIDDQKLGIDADLDEQTNSFTSGRVSNRSKPEKSAKKGKSCNIF